MIHGISVLLHRIGSVWFLRNMEGPLTLGANLPEHEFDLHE
jgi:hypothetical protein